MIGQKFLDDLLCYLQKKDGTDECVQDRDGTEGEGKEEMTSIPVPGVLPETREGVH